MTMRFFEYLQDDYGAAASDGVSADRGIDLASMAKFRMNQQIVADGPKFKAACSTMVKRAMFTNANMARVETVLSPTLSDMASDLSRMKSKLRELNDMLHEEAPALLPLQNLAALIESWPNWINHATAGVVPLIRQFVTLMGGYKTATGTAANALSGINDKIDYLNSVRSALTSRVDRTSIESDCNATSDKPMVEHVCTSYGINYRRMMKDREGTTAAWNEPCNKYYYRDPGGTARKFKHPPSFALNYAPMSSYYWLHGTELQTLYANKCELGVVCRGPTSSLYNEGRMASSISKVEGFLSTGPLGTEWERAAAEIEDDIKIYKAAIEQAMDQLAAIPKILGDPWVREFFIQLTLTAAGAHSTAFTLAFIPGIGPILAGIGEITVQSIAHWTWGQMRKKVKKHVLKVKKNKNAIIKKANTYWARAEETWVRALSDGSFGDLIRSNGALTYAQRGVVNFEKALPKRSLCNPIYPTRKAGTWAKLAGYPDVTQWSVACPVVSPTVAAPRTRRMPVPIYRPGTPEGEDAPSGGPGDRIAGPERESDMGAYGEYGALTAEPTTILGMKPWQAVLLAAGAYWLWTGRE